MKNKIEEEILKEFEEKFVHHSPFGVSIGLFDSFRGKAEDIVRKWLQDSLVALQQKTRLETIEEIANSLPESKKYIIQIRDLKSDNGLLYIGVDIADEEKVVIVKDGDTFNDCRELILAHLDKLGKEKV